MLGTKFQRHLSAIGGGMLTRATGFAERAEYLLQLGRRARRAVALGARDVGARIRAHGVAISIGA
jgi:hypothetical protein